MDQEHLHSKPALKYVRRHLRREQTPAERFLWQKLRNRQLCGRKFKRQHSIGRYVVDFYCAEERLAVELDGNVHEGPSHQIYNEERAQFLEAEGIRIVRFENREVFERLETVLEAIAYHFIPPS